MMSTRKYLKALCLLIVLVIGNARRGQGIRCSKCHAHSADDTCVTKPPTAHKCPNSNNCIAIAKYRQSGELFSFTRSCSPLALPEECLTGLDKATKEPLQVCYTTCNTDGCNGFITLHHILDLLRRK